jgi:hypothetical protein
LDEDFHVDGLGAETLDRDDGNVAYHQRAPDDQSGDRIRDLPTKLSALDGASEQRADLLHARLKDGARIDAAKFRDFGDFSESTEQEARLAVNAGTGDRGPNQAAQVGLKTIQVGDLDVVAHIGKDVSDNVDLGRPAPLASMLIRW